MAQGGWSALARAAVLLLLVAVVTLVLSGPPSLASTTATASAVSLVRAERDVRLLTRVPGQTGSEGNNERRRYILAQLAQVGVAAEVQSTDAVVSLLGRVIAARVHNVVARIPGREPGPAVLLSAHYDAVPNGPGASDDGAGVATLLETARVLRGAEPLRRDVILLFVDGEELGLLGAEAFASEHPLARRVGWVLNFEARGSRGASAMYETSLPNAGLVRDFARAAPRPVANSLISSLSRALPNDTDFTVYRRAGMAGYAFAFAGGLEDYHRTSDTAERLDLRSLAHHLSYAVSLTRELTSDAAAPATAVGNAVYFDIVGRTMVSFPAWLVRVLGVLAFVAWLAAWRAGQAAFGLRLRGMAWGALGALGCVLAAIAVGVVLDGLVGLALPLARRMQWASGLLVAHASLALVGCVEIYRRLLNRASAAELELASWGLGALLSVSLSLAAPGMTYAPVLSTLPGLGAWWWRRVRAVEREAAIGGAAALLVPAVFFVISVGYAFFVLMGTQLPAVTLLAVAWGAMLLLPWSAELWRARAQRWQLLLALAASAVVAGACGLGRLRPAPPTFTDLHYAFDVGTKRARFSATTGLSHPEVSRLLRGAAPPPSALPPSRLEVVSREPLPDGRYRQRLLLQPAAGVRCVMLTQVGGGAVLESRVNGRAPHPNVRFSPELDKKLWTLVTGQRLADAFNLGYCGAGSEPVELQLTTAGRSLLFAVSDLHDGLPDGLVNLPRLEPELRFDLNGNRTLIEHLVPL